tara:strand:- start:982 stop:1170 length:189 start_codon:yes stop_codon:yes gene_type:complete
MQYLKVEGHENFVRDTNTGAIINTSPKVNKSFSGEFQNALKELNTLKEEMSEIKSLLKQIVK